MPVTDNVRLGMDISGYVVRQEHERRLQSVMRAVLPGLVAGAINILLTDDGMGCCRICCAPCKALYDLDEAGALSDAVRPYVRRTGSDWAWWVGDVATGHVDAAELHRHWKMGVWDMCCGSEDPEGAYEDDERSGST